MTKLESNFQRKVLEYLALKGCYAIKVVSASKNGVHDVVGCTNKGRFFSIELKREDGTNYASELQKWNVKLIESCGGIAFVADNLTEIENRLFT